MTPIRALAACLAALAGGTGGLAARLPNATARAAARAAAAPLAADEAPDEERVLQRLKAQVTSSQAFMARVEAKCETLSEVRRHEECAAEATNELFCALLARSSHGLAAGRCRRGAAPTGPSLVQTGAGGSQEELAQEMIRHLEANFSRAVRPLAPAGGAGPAGRRLGLAAAAARQYPSPDPDGAPEQGFTGRGVEHRSGETSTGDWGAEYGRDSDAPPPPPPPPPPPRASKGRANSGAARAGGRRSPAALAAAAATAAAALHCW